MLHALLTWAHANPAGYWLSAWLAFGACLVSAVWPPPAPDRGMRWNSPVIFGLALCLFIVAFRWPPLGTNLQLLNPDESELIASALAFRHYGTIWGHACDFTAGPLIALPLVLPSLLGLPFDYTSARAVGLLLACVIAVSVWLILRHLHGDRWARLLTLPLACWLAFTTYWDFVQYSTEPPALACLLVAIWLLVTAWPKPAAPVSRPRLVLGGFLLGLVPFAKLQIAPIGFVFGLWCLARVLDPATGPARARLQAAACLLGGTVTAMAGVMLSLWWSKEMDFFWVYYVQGNVGYAAQPRQYPWLDFPRVLPWMASLDPAIAAYFKSNLLLLATAVFFWPKLAGPARRYAILGALLFLVAFLVIIAPGRVFTHYLQIGPPFLTLLVGALFGGWWAEAWLPAKWRNSALVLFLGVSLGAQVYTRATRDNSYLLNWSPEYEHPETAAALRVKAFTRPGDTMTVWGWAPRYYVQTGLPQATREGFSWKQIEPGPQYGYYHALYMADLARNRPAIFLDAVSPGGFGYTNRLTQGHEANADVRDFVAANYALVDEIEDVRIYVRRDRLAALTPPLQK